MPKKTRIFLSIIFICTVLSLCGCSGENKSSEIIYESNEANISCGWWGKDTRNEYTMNALKIFSEKNPDINITSKYGTWESYTKRQEIYMKSHDEPDVMLINYNWIDEYSPDGNSFYDLYKLSDYIDLSNFSEEELSYGEVDGKLNAIPIALNAQVLYYNKDIYNSYNLDIPKDWEDFFKAADVMKKDDVYPLSMGEKSLFFFLIAYYEQSTGKSVCDENGDFILENEDIKFMLEFYKRLIDEKVLMPIDKFETKSMINGKSAGVMRWASSSEKYFEPLTKNGTEIVVGPYPRLENAETLGWYIKPATLYAINVDTAYPVESARLVDFFLNSSEMAILQKNEKGIPISNNAAKALEENHIPINIESIANNQITENQKDMHVISSIMENDNVFSAFKQNADYYIYEKDSLENVAQMIYDTLHSS